MIVLTNSNIKGGVLKTTTTLNLGYGLGRAGKKVLFIDMDPQANLTYSATGVLSREAQNTIYEAIIPEEQRSLHTMIVGTLDPNVFIVPGSITLSSADIELAPQPGREWRLSNALEEFAGFCKKNGNQIDYVLIDTPPNLGLLSVNALVACGNNSPEYITGNSGFIIPVSADIYATIGIDHLKRTIAKLRKNLRIPIPFLGAVTTLFDTTKESARFQADIQKEFAQLCFDTVIPRNVAVKEANNYKNLYDYAPTSKGAEAYLKLTEEVMHRAENN